MTAALSDFPIGALPRAAGSTNAESGEHCVRWTFACLFSGWS
jgi:hypothetical protein